MKSRHGVGILPTEAVQLPYRMLALRVIDLAIRDAIEGQSKGIRRSARHFLSGCPLLSLWCALADIDPESIPESLREQVVPSTRPSPRTP